jgi:CheY-like chemotaxis protein
MNIDLIKTLTVLYVEDEIALRDITSDSISSIVKELDVADNGKMGLEKFQQNNYDLIISDLSMPIMDGITMIKEIRKLDKSIPIVITTAFSAKNEDVKYISSIEKTSYVMKPVDVMKLLEAIDHAII